MSRAFVKEDAPDSVVYIPPRAPLPAGAVNFVTERGLSLLRDEKSRLEHERERLKKLDPENQDRNRALTIVRGQLKELESRVKGAKLVKSADQPQDEVRFGSTVTTKTLEGRNAGVERTFSIGGVDEADISTMRVGYIAPLARALIGLKVGESAKLNMGGAVETLEVISVLYP